jgi:hypothetical protein
MLQSAACLARSARRTFAPSLLSLVLLATAATAPRAADDWPSSMHAVYEVNFNGFDIGSFEFDSQAEQESYTLAASAHLSVLLGAFTWDGQTRSFGLIAKERTRPAAFSFDFKSNVKAGSTTLGFSDDSVTSITQLPPATVNPAAIPLREDHLKGVVDPLTALMVLSRGTSSKPCQRRISIFDGRERFDLLFSYKGEMAVTELQASGQPGVAVLCKVRYLPIAGHRVDPDTQFMAANEEIEVALRPIPAANVFVPYLITVPTRIGTASLLSKRVEIASPGKPQIALLH